MGICKKVNILKTNKWGSLLDLGGWKKIEKIISKRGEVYLAPESTYMECSLGSLQGHQNDF